MYYKSSSNRSHTINTFVQNGKQGSPPIVWSVLRGHELTDKHILIECSFLKIIRRRHYDVTDLKLFRIVSSKKNLDFVNDVGLYNIL